MTDPNVGRVLDNRYELMELIGLGSMGRVYQARHVLLGGLVAVKFLSQTVLSPKTRERFFTEAKACAQLGQQSIYIIRVMDYGVDEGDIPFYVMEYLDGQGLKERIREGPMPLPEFFTLTKQICSGLQCAHDGIMVGDRRCPIIHRDIKPSNIFINHNPSLGEVAKILDFGIAKLTQEDSEQTKRFMGTLAYASPEQLDGGELDCRTDIYSMGIMMFQMLTSQIPIVAETHTLAGWHRAHHCQTPPSLSSICPDQQFPKNLEQLVIDCLAKQKEDRPATARSILDALLEIEIDWTVSDSSTGSSSQPFSEAPSRAETLSNLDLPNLNNDDEPETVGTPLVKPNIVKPNKVEPNIVEPNIVKPNKVEPNIRPFRTVTLSSTSFSSSDTSLMLAQHLTPDIQVLIWPEDKPKAEIVFAQPFTLGEEETAALWVMLPEEEIKQLSLGRLYNRLYKNFLCTLSPHPVVLWVTAIHNTLYFQKRGPRWLRTFLDLKSRHGQSLVRLLGENAHFYLLFFSLENPKHCVYSLNLSIKFQQAQLLSQWAIMGMAQVSPGTSQASKNLLRNEFEQLRTRVQDSLMVGDHTSSWGE